MRAWSLAAFVWIASCNEGDVEPGSVSGEPSDAGGASGNARPEAPGSTPPPADARVQVHAVFDLPRTARTRTLSALSGVGPEFYALPDKERRIVSLTANADYTRFDVADGTEITGLADGAPWDGEGLARAMDGSFYVVSSETTPTIVHVSATGTVLDAIETPARYAEQASDNKGLESLSLAPSGAFLFTSNESALQKDGPAASKSEGTVVRILRMDATTHVGTEYAYRTESLGAGSGGDMGVSDVLALSDDTLLVLERGYQSDYGNTVRIFRVSLAAAPSVSGVPALDETSSVLEKELLVDVATLPPGDTQHPAKQANPLLDNYEALTLGPTLPDGRRLLLLLSDDNGHASQVARVLVLAMREP